MKNTGAYYLLIFCFFFTGIIAKGQDRILTGQNADKQFSGSKTLRYDDRSSFPNYIAFQDNHNLTPDKLQQWISQYVETPERISLLEINTTTDVLGYTHTRYKQAIDGFYIENGDIITHSINGVIKSINGLLHTKTNVDTRNILNQSQAMDKALAKINAEVYKWQLEEEEKWIKADQNNILASFYPKGEFAIVSKNLSPAENLRLAWKFNIYAQKPMGRVEIFVDAKTGEILSEHELIHHADQVGTAITAYSGSKPITADQVSSSNYRLRETGRGNGIETYDMNQGTTYSAAIDFTDSDNNWNNINPEEDEYATDAHWGAEKTYDYFWTKHNRNSIDGNGFKIKSYVHYDANYTNAFWDGQRMTYGDGNGSYTPLTSIDIIGHEIAHGLTSHTANLVYQDEPGALNESFSDIFGVSIDYFARPAQANWSIGDEIHPSGDPFRSMSNPNSKGDPDTYGGTYWYTGSGDNGGVHTNSGVQNFWYYLMVNGGTGTNDIGSNYNVTGIGFTEASKIAFRNLTVYLSSTSNYADARFFAIQAAMDLFGPCSPQVETTTAAWYAVGVGNDYIPGVVADFTASPTSGCSAPLVVNFHNLSSNAINFTWDFGDGTTSNAINPVHTYQSNGTYDVELIADGGICGSDTTIKLSLIVIDTALPCIVILPNGGTAPTQTECSGTLFDDGGPNGNYSPNQDTYITINPLGANSVSLNFVQFDIEAGSGNGSDPCDYDFIEIFDGPNTGSPLIGSYCNSTGNPGVVSSTGGPITIHFHSDPGLELGGFEISWTCQAGPIPLPVADFTSTVDTVCLGGVVNFTNLSVNASSYQWTFPGGTPYSSNAPNPTTTYNTAGPHDVILVASNSSGSDAETKTNYIFVDTNMACLVILPPNTTLPNQTSCEGILVDDGGINGDYTTQYNSYVTIAPTGATTVDVNFLSFDVESGSDTSSNICDYDFLQLFDGPNTNAPSLGKFCGNNLPLGTISSTGPEMTVYFHSDQLITGAGYEMHWQCQTGGGSGLPTANFTSSPQTICAGSSVNFTNQSTNATSYLWTFNGGSPSSSTATNPQVTYNTAGVYSVTLKATNANGSNTLFQQNVITVNPNPNAAFSYSNGGNNTVNFSDQSTGSPTGWLWNFGDGFVSTSQNPSHIYSSDGNYTVCLTAMNSICPNSQTCMNVIVTSSSNGPVPVAAMTLSSNNICEGNMVNFFDQSSNNPTSWAWSFPGGNPSTSNIQNPTVTYSLPGTYSVNLIVSNAAGSDTLTNATAVKAWTSNNALYASNINGMLAVFTNQSTGGTGSSWSFGDGSSSNSQNPAHAYNAIGSYNVCLSVSNPGCPTDVYCDSIDILTNPSGPVPVAKYSLSSNNICINGSIQFFDQSSNAPLAWDWEFSGGIPNSSNQENPIITYNTPGNYTVKLTASNANGEDSIVNTNTIQVYGNPSSSFMPWINQKTVYFADSSSGASNWFWDFGDGHTSTVQSPQHTYSAFGTYYVCLITGNPSCADQEYCDSVIIDGSITLSNNVMADFQRVKIYPNPSKDIFNVVFEASQQEIHQLHLIDVLGKTYFSWNSTSPVSGFSKQIDARGLSSGIYILMIDGKPHHLIKN